MAYRIRRKESIPAAVRRIGREQIDKGLGELSDEKMDVNELVHQVRKRMKKMRALLRLVRGEIEETYQRENAFFRDIARDLSFLRDTGAILETVDMLIDRFSEDKDKTALLRETRRRLEDKREAFIEKGISVKELFSGTASRLRDARTRIGSWPLKKKGFDAVRPGLKKTYKRGRNAMAAAYDEPSAEHFHEWRKRVKYHWYHAHLLSPVWEKTMKQYCSRFKQLADYLGDNHDLDVLREAIAADTDRFGSDYDREMLDELIRVRRDELAGDAGKLGERLYAEKPGAVCNRIEKWFTRWKKNG